MRPPPPSKALRRARWAAHASRASGAAFRLPQKYPAPGLPCARRAQVRAAYPTHPTRQARPASRDLGTSPRGGPRRPSPLRPTLHPRRAAHTPGGPKSRPEESTPLRRSQPVGRAIGEIEAKDGLPSADRNNKATLLLTGPFRTAKSSAKDLTPLVLKLQYAKYHDALRAPWKNRLLRR